MLYPSINELRKKVDSRYTLVILASKRARDLIDGYPPLVDIGIEKPVSIATEEIYEDKITYSRKFHSEEEAEELAEEENEREYEAYEALHAEASIENGTADNPENTDESNAAADAAGGADHGAADDDRAAIGHIQRHRIVGFPQVKRDIEADAIADGIAFERPPG